MGRDTDGFGKHEPEQPAGFDWGLNGVGAADAVLVGGAANAFGSAPRARPAVWGRHLDDRPRIPWLRVLTGASAVVLALTFAYPLSRPAPGLRAAVETAITLMGLMTA